MTDVPEHMELFECGVHKARITKRACSKLWTKGLEVEKWPVGIGL